jgi:hypothetical protein
VLIYRRRAGKATRNGRATRKQQLLLARRLGKATEKIQSEAEIKIETEAEIKIETEARIKIQTEAEIEIEEIETEARLHADLVQRLVLGRLEEVLLLQPKARVSHMALGGLDRLTICHLADHLRGSHRGDRDLSQRRGSHRGHRDLSQRLV